MPDAQNSKKPTHLAAAIAGALAGAGLFGSGVVPPIIVQGDAPADAAGWECKPVGPPLHAQLVCHNKDTFAAKAQPLTSRTAVGWREDHIPLADGGNVTVMRPIFNDELPDAGSPDAGQ